MSADPNFAVADEFARASSHIEFPVVGIGASAGGIGALLKLFEHMPQHSGMAFVVILHLSPKHESNVDSILRKVTRMPVAQVNQTTTIEADHIYVISPTCSLTMSDGKLIVSEAERPRGRHVAIDLFFRTLADVHRDRSVCLVLSGTGSDGAVGLRRIKERGGVTLVQSPGDAEYDGMPLSAIGTGAVDFVLPVIDMPAKLTDIWHNAQRIELPHPEHTGLRVDSPDSAAAATRAEEALADVMVLLRARTGHDFRHYKRATVLRRLERRMQVTQVPTLPTYHAYLERHPEETGSLLNDLLISVTSFFRDREAWEALERQIDATLSKPMYEGQHLRAWVAGCATGEEAYSVAMLLDERTSNLHKRLDMQVFASDIDERAIAVGRAGTYASGIVADIPPARLRQYFSRESGQFRIRKELRERVLFSVHNLLRDPPFSRLDLACCRNLLIYLDREVQAQVLEMFHFALQPGGTLFLGSSETADAAPALYTLIDKKHRIYRSNAMLRRGRQVQGLVPDIAQRLAPRPEPEAQPPRTPLADLHRRLLEQHTLPSVLTDADANILHSSERAGAYLHFAAGTPTQNLLSVIRPELRIELRTTFFQAQQGSEPATSQPVRFAHNGHAAWLVMRVHLIREGVSSFVLVLFEEQPMSQAEEAAEPEALTAEQRKLALLEAELHRTREQLHGTIGQSATSNEELKASNEELQAINEELRSTTEELETSKEELQSVNEELITVNHELKSKIDETGKISDDLKNLIDSTDIATIFVDRAMRIKRYTPRAAELFNLIPADVGRSLMDIRHQLDYDELEDDATEAFQSLRTIERELPADNKRLFLARVLPYRTHGDVIDGAVLNFVDITALRHAERQARAVEADMRLVIGSTRDYAIFTLDLEGRVTSWNAGAERIFGWTSDEIVGQPGALVFTPEDRAVGAVEDEMRRAREDGRATAERWHLRKDGSTFFASGVMNRLDDGSLKGYAKIARDLTQAKREETLQQSRLAGEQATSAGLQAASLLKDEFLAVMSHELKHPLNLIHVNAEMLARLPEVRGSPTVARAAEVIRRTVQNQAKIIDDLLDLSRVHTGKLALNRVTMEFAPLVERILESVQRDAEERGLALSTRLDTAASLIHADPVRVEQIVWNLLSNALKFTPRGGSIEVALSAEGLLARLDVRDTGEGLAPSDAAQVFDPFRQVAATRASTRRQGGLGIGLALVKQLAEQQGGRAAVESEGPGRGACFSVWLPLAGDAAHADANPVALPELSGLRVLLVDDTQDTLESFGMLLGLEGADVTTAQSGRRALEIAEGSASFDLILSDIAMPDMDGLELMRRLRRIERYAEVPAIALTGFGRASDELRAIDAGFDAHLSKPVGMDSLIHAVSRLGRHPRRLERDSTSGT